MKIALLGDIAFFGRYSLENKDILKYFSKVSEKLKEFDHVVGNLETPIYNGFKTYGAKSAYIRSNEENIALLKYLNIDIVNLANNHIYDYGLPGMKRTILLLEKNGIGYFGVNNIQHRITDKNQNNKIAFSGYCCYSTNGVGYLTNDRKHGVNVLNAFKIEKNMIRNHEEGYFNILSIHAGEEHVHYPNYDHILMARKLASKVPYVYYGHHPHVIQGLEVVNKSLIAYSLGNFCFDDVYTTKSTKPLVEQTEANKNSFILSLEISNNNIGKYEVIPIYLNDNSLILYDKMKIKDYLIEYSKELIIDKNDYRMKRKIIMNDYLLKRKKMRDFSWYLKRININSFIIIINSYINGRNYRKYLKKYLKENKDAINN